MQDTLKTNASHSIRITHEELVSMGIVTRHAT
jgi:hypothetical protein